MIKVEFETENAAFEEYKDLEVARIFREMADKIEAGVPIEVVRDINGNRVGTVEGLS
jgi:hypothetical protein